MKKLLLSAFALGIVNMSFGAIYVVATTGSFTFLPATTSAVVGDTIAFNVNTGHTATSVTQGAWAANQATPTTGAFNFTTFPGGAYIIPAPAAGTTIYFVCSIHVGTMGMKGQINVAPVSVTEVAQEEWSLSAYPNPAENVINLLNTGSNGKVSVHVLNLLGAEVLPMVTVDAATYRINLTALSEGTYFIRVENGDRAKVIRFMKK